MARRVAKKRKLHLPFTQTEEASMAASTWAVILCKFADDANPTPDRLHYERLFTGAGAGALNMVDFFLDMSHGQVDLTNSEVFGWYTLAIDKSAYVGNTTAGPGQYDRNGLVQICENTARLGGAPIDSFDGRVISMSGGVDLFGSLGGMTAFCDSNSLSPSPLGQEMGHGYGLDHARRDGSTADYLDPWDVMSVYAAYMAYNSEWGTVGPGLNAWCMRSRGWLDETRVWSSPSSEFTQVIQLRPLHRRDLSGFLAAEVGPYLVEYRAQQRWDAAFPRSAVFVHSFSDNHSYVMPSTNGNFDLAEGDILEAGDDRALGGSFIRVEVMSIDDSDLIATLRLRYARRIFLPPQLVGTIVGGVAVDGGGGLIIGGKFHPIPPRGPETDIAKLLAGYLAAQDIVGAGIRIQAQRTALQAVARLADIQASQLQTLRSPAPKARE